jgi:4-hydroxybutyrate CoA-transferase
MKELKYISADEAVRAIKSGDRVFIHGGAATPTVLIKSLTRRNCELENVEIVHIHTEGEIPYIKPEYSNSFQVNCFFVGNNIRPGLERENIQYVPVFLSEIPALFRKGLMPIDVAIIQVSEPDTHGFCSLGVSVDVTKAATDVAQKIIALVNPNMPRSHGDSQIHINRFHSMVHTTNPIYEFPLAQSSELEMQIGRNVAGLIEDGATLQFGIGGIPGAVCRFLNNHKNLGIHTEMFTDAILPLVESGVINGIMKKKHPGKIVSTFAMGTRKLYDFIHDNPQVAMLDAGYVNDTHVIRKNPKATAINSAIEIDLTGQICADSIGSKIYSGVGGQMDFIRGASLSDGGKPIITMTSRSSKGVSKIVHTLKQGAGVVTTRAHVHFIVTEYGIADLYGKNLSQRAKELIQIAHPDDREELEILNAYRTKIVSVNF